MLPVAACPALTEALTILLRGGVAFLGGITTVALFAAGLILPAFMAAARLLITAGFFLAVGAVDGDVLAAGALALPVFPACPLGAEVLALGAAAPAAGVLARASDESRNPVSIAGVMPLAKEIV